MSPLLLDGRIAIVTGASRGIGRAIAETLQAQGARVLASARVIDEPFAAWAASLGITPFALDLADDETIKEALKAIRAAAPEGVDILVNNAGAPHGALFQMTSMKDLRALFEVNLFGQIALTQGVVRLITKRKGGAIVNIASTAALVPDPGTLVYGSTKAALIRASESMATELGRLAIRVNAVAPGVTRTDMLDQMDPQAVERLIAASALRRLAEPQDIANAVLFLVSPLSSHITGQTLRVDGGLI